MSELMKTRANWYRFLLILLDLGYFKGRMGKNLLIEWRSIVMEINELIDLESYRTVASKIESSFFQKKC